MFLISERDLLEMPVPRVTTFLLKSQQTTAMSDGVNSGPSHPGATKPPNPSLLRFRHHITPLLLGRDPLNLNQIHEAIYQALKPAVSNGHPFAKATIDMALHDLRGRMLDVPLHTLFGGKRHDRLPLCYALSIDTPEIMGLKAQALFPCSCFKVKVAGVPAADEERLRAVHEAAPNAKLWIDANQSYTPSNALELLKRVADIP